MKTTTWKLDDAEVQIHELEIQFWNCQLKVQKKLEDGYFMDRLPNHSTHVEVSGTLRFTHPIPKGVFFDKNGVPKNLDVVARADGDIIEIDQLFGTNSGEDRLEFVAITAHRTVTNKGPSPTIGEQYDRLMGAQ